MDSDIQNWSQLWSHKKATKLDIVQLSERLQKIEQVDKLKRFFIPVLLISSVAIMVYRLTFNTSNFIAIALVISGFLVSLAPLFRTKSKTLNVATLTNKRYIKLEITRLKGRLDLPKNHFLISCIVIPLGMGIGYFSSLENAALEEHLFGYFILVTLFLALLYLRKLSIKKHQNHLIPIISDLETVLVNLEECTSKYT